MKKKYVYLPTECFYCAKNITHRFDHTYDHVIPLAKGGKNTFDNVVDCCSNCNHLKADLTLEAWRESLRQQIKEVNSNHPKFLHYNSIITKLNEALDDEV